MPDRKTEILIDALKDLISEGGGPEPSNRW